jgi:hypothetical protein
MKRLTIGLLSFILLAIWLVGLTAPLYAQDDGTPQNGNRLFVDDFTTYVNRWDRIHSAKYTADYLDFSYQFDIRSPGIETWAKPHSELSLDRYVIEVTAAVMVDGASDGFCGLLINYQDENNFYVFGLNASGSFEVRLRQNGNWNNAPLAAGQTPIADTYHLRIENQNGIFRIRVNGEPAIIFNDTELAGGGFGLYAQAGRGQLLVSFDDYLVHDLG